MQTSHNACKKTRNMIYFAQKTRLQQTRFRLQKVKEEGHRMTMEQQKFQPILNSSERDEPFPTETTDTNPNITRGDNVTNLNEARQNYSPEIQAAVASEISELESWLSVKVKNELVAQIYTSVGNEESGINITSIKETLASELAAEKAKNLNQAAFLYSRIPLASARKELNPTSVHDYGVKDVAILQRRIDVHREVITTIKAVESTGDQGLYDLAEVYVQEVQLEARDEVLSILNQQKKELEVRNTSNEAKIVELEAVIGTLQTEIEFAHEQLEDRDMALLDNQLETNTQELTR